MLRSISPHALCSRHGYDILFARHEVGFARNREEKVVRERRGYLLALFGTLLSLVLAACASVQVPPTATAELKDKDGTVVGNAQFSEDENGVNITATVLQGLEPGEYGIHVHEKGETTPDFEAAGKHFNPTEAKHGFNNPEGPHAGDLENIIVREDGTADYQATTDRVTLASGEENSLLDGDGSALVIHAKADDYMTDPSGESGDRVVAGVIEGS
jgi:Cu-Zn family superoxide dismutase